MHVISEISVKKIMQCTFISMQLLYYTYVQARGYNRAGDYERANIWVRATRICNICIVALIILLVILFVALMLFNYLYLQKVQDPTKTCCRYDFNFDRCIELCS